MKKDHKSDEFVTEFSRNQRRIYAYVLTLLGNRADAEDVLQQASLVMWRKSHEFQSGTNFCAWGCQIAHFEVLAFKRRQSRDLVYLSDSLIDLVANEVSEQQDVLEDRYRALRHCLSKLNDRDRDLVGRRYRPDVTSTTVAEQVSRSVKAVSNALSRIRRTLLECIDRTLAAEGRA